jgi:hypothetical protein
MTNTENTAGTALEQVAPGVIAQVTGAKTLTVADLANMLAAPVKPVAKDAEFPPVASPVKFTDALRKHLKDISSLFGNVMPTERRKLERAEVKYLTDEALAIDILVKELGTRRKAISELMRMHQDFEPPRRATPSASPGASPRATSWQPPRASRSRPRSRATPRPGSSGTSPAAPASPRACWTSCSRPGRSPRPSSTRSPARCASWMT